MLALVTTVTVCHTAFAGMGTPSQSRPEPPHSRGPQHADGDDGRDMNVAARNSPLAPGALKTAQTTAPNAALELAPAPLSTRKTPQGVGGRFPQTPSAGGRDELKRQLPSPFSRPTSENITIERAAPSPQGQAGGPPWYRGGLTSLLAVLGVIAAVTLLAKRYVKGGHVTGSDALHLLCRTHLSSKQSIGLVRMGAKLLFVGITPESITPLRIVEDRAEIDLLIGKTRSSSPGPRETKFDKLLDKEAQQFVRAMDERSEAVTDPEGIANTRRQLKGLRDRLRSYQLR